MSVRERQFLGRLGDKEDRSGVLVYVTGFSSPPPREAAVIEQREKTFHPGLLPVVAGQTVRFPNRDPIYHNVFSVSPTRPFDLGQYKSTDKPPDVIFDAPGLVPVYCNIHPEMISYVVVLENSAFAVTGSDGRFRISGVPAGAITVNAWAPGAERASRDVAMPAEGTADVDLTLTQEAAPPHKRKDGSAYPRPPDVTY